MDQRPVASDYGPDNASHDGIYSFPIGIYFDSLEEQQQNAYKKIHKECGGHYSVTRERNRWGLIMSRHFIYYRCDNSIDTLKN